MSSEPKKFSCPKKIFVSGNDPLTQFRTTDYGALYNSLSMIVLLLDNATDSPQKKSAPTQAGKKVPRSVSVVAKSGSSLAKSAPVQIPDPVKRSYSLNFLREKMSDGEIADGMSVVDFSIKPGPY